LLGESRRQTAEGYLAERPSISMDGESQQTGAVGIRAQLPHRYRANAVILDVEPTPARTYDGVETTKTMLDRTERRFELKPKRLAADTGTVHDGHMLRYRASKFDCDRA
jgi:hypothetical protein